MTRRQISGVSFGPVSADRGDFFRAAQALCVRLATRKVGKLGLRDRVRSKYSTLLLGLLNISIWPQTFEVVDRLAIVLQSILPINGTWRSVSSDESQHGREVTRSQPEFLFAGPAGTRVRPGPTCAASSRMLRFATRWKEQSIQRLASFQLLSGFGAGYLDYPWFFGTDGAFTTYGLTATGQC